jgi:hypothetical protein
MPAGLLRWLFAMAPHGKKMIYSPAIAMYKFIEACHDPFKSRYISLPADAARRIVLPELLMPKVQGFVFLYDTQALL